MKANKHILILVAGMLILALVAAGCQSSKKPESPPDGEYSKAQRIGIAAGESPRNEEATGRDETTGLG